MEEQVVNNQVQQPPVNPASPKPNHWLIAIIILVLILIVGGFYALYLKSQKIISISPTTISQPSPTPDPTANWKTYTNTKYGFSFKYSDRWGIESSPRNRGEDVNTVDSVRFYNLSDRLEIEKYEKDCDQKFAKGATSCAGSTYEHIAGYYIYIIENISKLNQEEFFKTQLSYISEQGKESIGSLSIIKGVVKQAGGGAAYYFLNPTQTFAVLIDKDYASNIDESLRTIDEPIYQILSTFKFTNQAPWKTYTNKTFGFSFSYPSNLTVSVGPDESVGLGSIDFIGNDTDKVVASFYTMRTGQGAYCYEGGTIDLSTTPAPTTPMKIAEAEAICECNASGVDGYRTCSKTSEEKTLSRTSDNIIGYKFFLEQEDYSSSSKHTLTGSQHTGPYQAYFFPKPVIIQDTEYIGIYFKLSPWYQINTFDQIISTFKFLDQKEEQVACTVEVKLCPDGSYVSRQPPTCEFANCP